ncbi:FISUMP domain-containing protein [Flavobacterium sp.]|jgi:uncharacterized protein (TIGR02145 family)|uniref:FISUMP domain-containing protein n=1 Tax=Flavobacterium sp. TaxID=239 RepID=UPI0037BEE70F
MKKLFTLFALVLTLITNAQAPQGFNYQATVRNSSGALIVNQNVNFKFNIMLNSATSLPVFSETHMAPTDDLGQVNLVIGQGTASVGSFSTINWGTGNYYLGIELNTGSGYVAMGTTQLLSVPYALYANSSGNAQAATPNLASVLAENNGANNLQIKNLADPTDAQDAVTKSFSEAQLQSQVAQLQAQIVSLQDQISLIQNPTINVIPSPTQASICSGTNTNITLSNSNNSPNITYSWTASCISGTISGYYDQPQSPISMINQVLTNTGTSSGLVRYVVTPYLGANSGQSVNVDVTVNGPYQLVNTLPLYVAGACQNQLPTPLSAGNPNPAYNYQWCIGGDALSAIPIPGATNSIFIPPTNNIGITMYCCLVSNILNQCDFAYSQPTQFTVSPLPSIDDINVNIISGNTINLTPTNGGGINNSDVVPPNTIYSWTNNNPAIGLVASGTGTDLIFTPINSGTTPMVAQIIVTPSTVWCQGESFTITLTINPSTAAPLPNVIIGTQIWTNTNLDVTTYRDGTPIPQVTDPTAWAGLTTGAWCYYNNDPANGAVYGKLYNWYAVAGIHDAASLNNPSLRKQFAPQGWHIPSDAEWTILTDFLGGQSVAGGKMKSTGTIQAGTGLWASPNAAATNESGFTGLPAGSRHYYGAFGSIGFDGRWWSSSESSATSAWGRDLDCSGGNAYRNDYDKEDGFSVRCVRD